MATVTMVRTNFCFWLLTFMAIACSIGIAFKYNIKIERSDDDDDNAKEGFGRPQKKDPSKTTYYMMAEDALKKYEEDTQSESHYAVLKVHKVTEQLVAGTLTKIDFDAAPLRCRDSGILTPSFCQIATVSKVLHCHAEIWTKLWENFKEITIRSCRNQSSSSHY